MPQNASISNKLGLVYAILGFYMAERRFNGEVSWGVYKQPFVGQLSSKREVYNLVIHALFKWRGRKGRPNGRLHY